MWKLVVGFVAFAALAIWVLSKGGAIDMGGEKHDLGAHSEPAAAEVAASAVPASLTASAASQ